MTRLQKGIYYRSTSTQWDIQILIQGPKGKIFFKAQNMMKHES